MDIRNFFSVSSQSRSTAIRSDSKNKSSSLKHGKEKSRKRATAVLSDSDSESPLPRTERTKVKTCVIDDDSDSDQAERMLYNKRPKKELELKLTDADDYFGSAPVKRQNKSNASRKDANTTNKSEKKPSVSKSDVKKSKEMLKTLEGVTHEVISNKVSSSPEKEVISSKVTYRKSPRKLSPKKEALIVKVVSTVKNSKAAISEINSKKELERDESSEKEYLEQISTKTELCTPEKKHTTYQKESITPAHTQELKQLESKNDSEKKRALYRQYLERKGPQELGSKSVPEGKPGCLSGLTFVITGILESFERDETKEMIERYKGKVTTSLSKNTNYLVIGRDPGPAKLEKAQKLGTKLLKEDELLELISSTGGHSNIHNQKSNTPYSSSKGKNIDFVIKEVFSQDSQIERSKLFSAEKTNTSQKEPKQNVSPVEFTKVTKRKTSDKPTDSDAASTELQISKKARKSLSNFISAAYKSNETADALKCEIDKAQQINTNHDSVSFKMWVDKYKPSTTKQIIGQQGDRSNVKKLQQWLLSWYKNHDGKKFTSSKWYSKDDGSSCKAALLSGPPGVGKTTSAQLVCKECNFDYTELNASDTRSKKSLKELVEGPVSNKTLSNYACGEIQNGMSVRHAIIMDEVDGMAGNQDRGGVQELIALIKSSKIPIICICNDRSSPKIRSLSNYCYDLRFQRPRVEQIKSSMMSIAYKENIQMAPNVLQDVIIASNHDIRQVLHSLSLWCAKKQLTADQAKNDIGKRIKNVNVGPFEALRKIFSHSEAQHMSIHDKSDLFFTDYSLIPLFVQENYISVKPAEAKNDITKHLQLLSGTADSICDGDLVEKQIRTNGNWSLLPVEAIFASVIPGEIMSGGLTQMINFPSWLGKNSTVNHMKRNLQQLHGHMRLRISANKTDLQLDQLGLLGDAITKPLIEREVEGVGESISMLSNYCLSREDVDCILEVTHWPGKKNPMSNISPRVKSAFTRMYNKEGIMNPYSVVNIKKSRKRESDTDLLAEVDNVHEISDDGSDDDISTDAMVKIKKSTKKISNNPGPKKKGKTKRK